MTLIATLGRSRIGAWFAWLAVLSVGVLATGREALAVEAIGSPPERTIARALKDVPGHAVRAAAIKLTVATRLDGRDHRPADGPDPVVLPATIALAAPSAVAPTYRLAAAFAAPGSRATPYAARAPPAPIV